MVVVKIENSQTGICINKVLFCAHCKGGCMRHIVLWCFVVMALLPGWSAKASGDWMIYNPEGTGVTSAETMAVDSVGRIWMAGKNNGIYSLYEGSWTHELDNLSVQALTVDEMGTVWAVIDGVLHKRSSGSWSVVSDETFGTVYKIIVDRNGTVWAIVNPDEVGAQLIYFQDGAWDGISLPIGNDMITSLAVAPDNTLWVGTPADGVFFVTQGFAHQFEEALPKLPSLHIRDIYMGNEGEVWIATDQGVARFDGEDWKVFTKGKLSLPESNVPALAVDRQNGLWVLTRPLARYYENVWDTVAWPGASGKVFTTMVVDRENYVWLGAADGSIARYDGVTTGIDELIKKPYKHLATVYPNPFHSDLRVDYTVPDVPKNMTVTVTVTDVLGREIRTLVRSVLPPGEHSSAWDGLDAAGNQVPAGIYYCRIVLGKSSSLVPMQKVL
jgi:ligand-binding sensor domain-containing protein